MPKASNPPPAEKEATLSVNRNYEALLDKKFWRRASFRYSLRLHAEVNEFFDNVVFED